MRSRQLAILDDAWRRSNDRREPHLWIAAAAGPLAWISSLLGVSVASAVLVAVIAGVFAGIRLHEFQRIGDLSWHRSWFLAETAVAMSIVSAILIALAAL